MDLFKIFTHIDTQLQKSKEAKLQNQKERFEKIFAPIYQDVIEVHNYYLELFKSIRDRLPVVAENDNSMAHTIDDATHYFKIGGEEYRETIKDFKKRLISEERDSNDRFRDQVKAQIFSWLVHAQGMEEKKFVLSLVQYFLEQKGHTMDDQPLVIRKATELEQYLQFQDMNNFDESKVTDFLNRHFDTPKSMIYGKLLEIDDAEEMRIKIIEIENDLGWYMKLVSTCYVKLQASVYQI